MWLSRITCRWLQPTGRRQLDKQTGNALSRSLRWLQPTTPSAKADGNALSRSLAVGFSRRDAVMDFPGSLARWLQPTGRRICLDSIAGFNPGQAKEAELKRGCTYRQLDKSTKNTFHSLKTFAPPRANLIKRQPIIPSPREWRGAV